MNGDTFSRIEEWMVEFHRVPHRASAQFADREHGDRVAEQITNVQSVSPLAMLTGVSRQEAITAIAQLLTSEERPLPRDPTPDQIRDIAFDGLLESIAERDQRIAHLERELAELRASQRSEDPTGAHPYRSAAQTATAGPSSPVATSGASERVDGRPGALRRVWGALSGFGWPLAMAATCMCMWWGAATHDPAWGIGGLIATVLVGVMGATQLPEHAR